MNILERHVHQIRNAAAYWERERKFKEIEDRLGGFPPKRYYHLLAGADDTGTMVQEREWESMAAMEAAMERLFSEPGVMELGGSGPDIGNTERTELYNPITLPP